jgi:ABC-type multidrug transport system fused ATPase/permease subunit
MNTVQAQGVTPESIKTLLWLLMATFVIEVVGWAFHGPGRLLERANAFGVRVNYRRHLVKGTMTLPLEWHVDHHSGDTIDKIEKGANGLYQFASSAFEIIYGSIQLVGSYCVLAYFSPPAAVIVGVMVLLTVWIVMRFDRVIVEQYRELSRAENRISESVFDAVSNVTTVIILRVEKLVFESIVHEIEKPRGLFNRNVRLNEWKWFWTSMCCTVMPIAVLGVYFWQHMGAAGGILIGSTYLLVQYLQKIGETFSRFTTMYGDVLQRRAWVANAELLANDFRSESFANHVLPRNWQQLEIENLSFSYLGNHSNSHLSEINLAIEKGEKIAFVGETGSGKTTLLKVMRDLYHPQSLTLSVDGNIIPHGFEGISRAIALVPQDPEIFATTILENITLGARHPTDFVRRFTDMACFTEVADGLPNGFNSSIKEKGVNLSGGQQQRLALSRGLLACHDKDIVLLDEPTSSLDAITEMKVYKNIFSGFVGKTVISSIHRLHLLPLFDRICMFEGGRIIAEGTLPELLSVCPKFASLWEAMQKSLSQ